MISLSNYPFLQILGYVGLLSIAYYLIRTGKHERASPQTYFRTTQILIKFTNP